ncbi:MAG: NAD-dependent epimerase/dehydratase family protein [Phocaeicola sp.]
MILLFTGASGFLGNHLKPLLKIQNNITTLGIDNKDNIQCDLSKTVPILPKTYKVVLHAAGKAHSVPKSEVEVKLFFDVNLQGTINLCKGLEMVGVPESFIFISTVAVYGRESGSLITEDHALNGTTPYALSKIEAEKFLTKWCEKHKVILTILRPALIAGENAPGNLGAMVNGIKNGKYLSIAKGKARKSVLMVEEIAKLVPRAAKVGGVYNICDNHHPSFRELEKTISNQLGKATPISIPYIIAKGIALVGDLLGDNAPLNSLKLSKIVKDLTFSNEKAKKQLDWEPIDVLSNYKI